MRKQVIDLARYVRALGFWVGVRAYWTLHFPATGVAEVVLPSFSSPIRARRGTVDVDVFDQIFVMKNYNLRVLPHWQALYRKYEQILASGRRPLIVDCGANIGFSAVYFVHLFPKASVVCIEPEAHNIEMLRQNVAAYPLVIPVCAAVSDHKGWVNIANPEAHSWAFQVAESQDKQENSIPTVTIDDARQLVKDNELLIVKVDIEGAEEQLFRSNVEWVSKAAMVSIELHDWMLPWGGSSRNFFRAVRELQFDFLLAGENAFIFNWAVCLI